MRTAGAAIVLSALLLAGCNELGGVSPRSVDSPPAGAGEIPFSFAPQDAAIIIPVKINGEGPFDFILDTGATLTCVDEALAARLGLPDKKGIRGIGAGARSSGAIRLVSLESLEVGDATANDLTACSLDFAHVGEVGIEIDGLLGLNVLKEFTMVLDFDRKILRLETPGASREETPEG
jgi:hypothetical protein